MIRFTYDDFRRTDELRVEWRNFLNSDVGKIIMRVMREKYRPEDVPSNVDALASARVLSQFHGAHACLDDLETLTMPIGQKLDIETSFQASDTDHERMPSEQETRPVIKSPFIIPG